MSSKQLTAHSSQLTAMFPNFLRSLLSQQRIAGGAAVLALTQLGASVVGLIRDRVLAATFPPGIDSLDVVSVYIAAFRPSDLLFQIFVMSAFSVALVPLLAGHLARGEQREMHRLLSSILFVASLLFGALAFILALAFEWLAPAFVSFEGERLALYVQFGRIACLTNVLFVLGNAYGQYLITKQVYWAYGITPILYTLGTIAGTVFLTDPLGPTGPIFGTVVGAIIYTFVRALSAKKQGFVFSLTPPLFHPEMKEMGWLMLPRMLALGALQVQLLLFDKVASGLPLGSVTVNAYARNFQAAAVGIVGIALAQSAYSLLSQAVAKGELERFWGYVRKGTALTLGLAIPAAIILILLARVAAWIVHLTEPRIVETFIIALGIYALSIPFESLNHLLLRAIYATKHTAVPAVLSVLNGALAITCAWIFAPSYGVYALAAGFLIGQFVELVSLWIFLTLRVQKVPPLSEEEANLSV
jgi:putative peptidoglycan lipid II flippase